MSNIVHELINNSKESNEEAHIQTAKILAKIGKPAVESLIAALDCEELQSFASLSLKLIGKPSIKPLIEEIKRGKNEMIASSILTEIGTPAVLPLLDVQMGDNEQLNPIFAKIITNIGKDAVARLIAILKRDKGSARYALFNLMLIGLPALGALNMLKVDTRVSNRVQFVAGKAVEGIKKMIDDNIRSELSLDAAEEAELWFIDRGDIALQFLVRNLLPGDNIEDRIIKIMMAIGGSSIHPLNQVVGINESGEYKLFPPEGELLKNLVEYLGRVDGDSVKKSIILYVFSYTESDDVEKAITLALDDKDETVKEKAAQVQKFREQFQKE